MKISAFHGVALLALVTLGACSDDGTGPLSAASLDPTAGASMSSVGTSSGGSDGTTGSSDGTSTGGSTDDPTTDGTEETGSTGDEPVVCNPVDDLEPNELEEEAILLPNITDEDASGDLVESILAGEQDVDWFAYMGKDVILAVVDPAGTLASPMNLRLCVFVECVTGSVEPLDCLDGIYDESPDGLPGCCNSGESAFVSVDLYCSGSDDESAYVFMRVDQGHSDQCVPYQLEYHF